MNESSDSSYSYSDSSEKRNSPLLFDFGELSTITKNITKNFKLRFFRILFPKSEKRQSLDFNTKDVVAVIFFTFLGVFTRLFRIYYPKKIVFDESCFGHFINKYMHGEYFDDIHPPLAKLIMAAAAAVAGYKSKELNFRTLYATQEEYPEMIYVSLRVTPAIFAGLVVPLIYITARILNLSFFSSFATGIFLSFELLFIVEGKYILTDGILHFFSMAAILSIFLFDRIPNIYTLIFEGICLGACISCKYTAGGILLLAIFMQFKGRIIIKKPLRIPKEAFYRSLFLVFIATFVLYVVFYIHISILPYQNELSVHAPKAIKAALVDRVNPNWGLRYKQSMFKRIVSLFFSMLQSNMNKKPKHSNATRWYHWPFQTSYLLLFYTDQNKHYIYAMGNVLIWTPLFFVILFSFIHSLIEYNFSTKSFALVFGYFVSYLPFILMKRDTFIYHYCIPLLFGYLNLSMFIENHFAPKKRGFLLCLMMFLTILGFYIWSPWVYGLTTQDFKFLTWNKQWPLSKTISQNI